MANSVERYYQKKKRRKKRAKVVFFGLLFVLMMLTLAILSVTVFFNAETILVEGNHRYTAEELLEIGDLQIGQNLFRLDKFEVIDQMKSLPYVKTVTIKRKLPNTLTVKVVENQPVVWIKTDTGAAFLNEEYRVLELLNLPEGMIPADEEPEKTEQTEKTEKTEETEEPEEKPAEESAEQPEGEEITSPLDGIPRLTQIAATELKVGETAVFGELDYTGFLKRLYEGFSKNPDLDWKKVREVQFFARYDIQVLYDEQLTIDFGTLDQTDTKLELAAYLIKDNGVGQSAIVDVSDVERVYFRPKRPAEETPKTPTADKETN